MAKGINSKYDLVKLVSKIVCSLLSVGQLTEKEKMTVNFKWSHHTISINELVVSRGRRADDNLYKIPELTTEKVLNVEETAEINSGTEDSKESGREKLYYHEYVPDF